MSMAQRRFNSEVAALIDAIVTVVTTDNKTYTGTLIGVNPENLNLVLSDAEAVSYTHLTLPTICSV